MIELIPLLMFLVVCIILMFGYPVALSLAGTALIFAFVGSYFEIMDAVLRQEKATYDRFTNSQFECAKGQNHYNLATSL